MSGTLIAESAGQEVPRLETAALQLDHAAKLKSSMRGAKDAINTAQAFAPGNVRSNQARVLVRMNDELFSQKGFIVGRAEGEP